MGDWASLEKAQRDRGRKTQEATNAGEIEAFYTRAFSNLSSFQDKIMMKIQACS